jgi:hypothetical protein
VQNGVVRVNGKSMGKTFIDLADLMLAVDRRDQVIGS